MNNPTPQITNTKFIELLKTYWAWRRLWIGTTVLFGGLGLIYVLFLKNDMWTAAQGLIVRDEANGAVMRLGRFQSQTEMKAAQETILEMARNTQVLREALLEVGPAKSLLSFNKISESWPSQREVAELAEESIGVRAPQGAEFGTTEVIYLDIKQHTRDRALDLNKAVCEALDNRLRQVRVARADGVINELVRASSMATDDLKKAAEQLQIVEREAGADLADLRGLSEANGSGSAARSQLENVKTELRQVETVHASLQSDLALLRETQADPHLILSAPASILSAHPGLKKLREGLADAQLNTSQLRGRFTNSHPLVYVATSAEAEIKQQLHTELAQATSNSQREVNVSQARLDKLKAQQAQLEERLQRLARIRTEHEQLNQEVRSRTKILQDAERQLADTRAARDAALSTSLLTRIDDPVLGERPVGPGRSTILAAMTMAGLCFGLGIVFLLTPLDGAAPDSGRWNEQLGRRISDRFPWLADQAPGGGPRRRRNDVERRQPDRQPERGSSPSVAAATGRGRRQSDQVIAASTPVAAAPHIEEEDPSVASRLDDMLRSELAAMAPVPIERESVTVNMANTADSNTASPAAATVDVLLPAAMDTEPYIPRAKQAINESKDESASLRNPSTLASPSIDEPPTNLPSTPAITEQSAEPTTATSTGAKKPVRPRLRNRSQDRTKSSSKAKSRPAEEVKPTHVVQPIAKVPNDFAPVSAAPAAPVATPQVSVEPPATRLPTPAPIIQPAVQPMVQPVEQMIAQNTQPKIQSPAIAPVVVAQPVSEHRVAEDRRVNQAVPSAAMPVKPRPAPLQPTPPSKPIPVAPRPVTSQATQATQAAQATRIPIAAQQPIAQQPLAPQPVTPQPITQQPMARQPIAQQPAPQPAAPQPADAAKPSKPLNLFKPNQSLEADNKPQKPRPTGFVPPVPPQPKPAPLPNSFETTSEGGLAGIGLPTQKLPDSFQFRNGS